MVQCMMTGRFFFGTNAPRKAQRSTVALSMRSKSIGRKQPAAQSIVATLKTKKTETTGTTNSKRGIGPAHFFQCVHFDRSLDQIIQMQLDEHATRINKFETAVFSK
jgi:hypothetical protein